MALRFVVDGADIAQILTGYSVTEDATPLSLDGGTGAGTGAATFNLGPFGRAKYLKGVEYLFEDDGRGMTAGRVETASGSSVQTTASVVNALSNLVVEVVAKPYTGTLQGAIAYYLDLCGVTAFYIDAELANRSITLPGFTGSCWDFLGKQLAAVEDFEVSFVSNRIVVRGLRQRQAVMTRDIQPPTWTQDIGQRAQAISLTWYRRAWAPNALVYPAPEGWNESATIITVDAGTVTEHELEVTTSVLSVVQPVPVDTVLRGDTGSVYSVSGSDNLPITAEQWTAMGGSLTVSVSEDDPRVLVVRIVAPNDTQYAPYSLSVSDGSGDYSSLRVRGSGVTMNESEIVVETGLTRQEAPTEMGAQVDGLLVGTPAQAYTQLLRMLARYSSGQQSLAIASGGVHKVGDTGSYRRLTVAEWNAMAAFAGKTVGQVNDTIGAVINGSEPGSPVWQESGRNLARHPVPVANQQGWTTAQATQYPATHDPAGGRRVGTAAMRTDRSTASPNTIIGALVNAGALANNGGGRIPVTPGETMTFSLWVKASVDGRARGRLLMLNSGGSLIEDAAVDAGPIAAGEWKRIAITATVPAGGVTARLDPTVEMPPEGYTPWVETLRNLVVNPRTAPGSGSVETLRNLALNPLTESSTANSFGGGAMSISYVGGRVRGTAVNATGGGRIYLRTVAGTNNFTAATAGQRVSMTVEVTNPNAVAADYRINFQWDGPPATTVSPTITLAPGESAVLEFTDIVPSGAVGIAPAVSLQSNGAGLAAEATKWALYLGTDGDIPTSSIPFFSGASAAVDGATYSWNGAANASASIERRPNMPLVDSSGLTLNYWFEGYNRITATGSSSAFQTFMRPEPGNGTSRTSS